MRKALAAGLFVTGVLFAQWFVTRAWDGQVFVYVGEHRSPASVRSVDDYSAISGRALNDSIEAQVLANATIVPHASYIGVRLGNPLVSGLENGRREFACDIPGHLGVFDHVELVFHGIGITDNGEPPTLLVDAACQSTTRPDVLDVIWLPREQLAAHGPADQELDLTGNYPMYVKLEHMPGDWPVTWVLMSVRFYGFDEVEDGLYLDAARLRRTGNQVPSFNWEP